MAACALLTSALALAGQEPATLISRSEQQALLQKVATYLRDEYVFPDIGAAAAAEITRRAAAVDDKPMAPAQFASEWSAVLGQLTHDRHVRIRYAPAAGAATRMPQELDPSLDNFGIRRVEWLPERLGYLKIDRFSEADESRRAFDAALTLLAPATAVVIDLRDNGGGSDANALLASYFFDERLLFNELRWRKEDTEQIWTDPSAQPRLAKIPVFILTSARTFSAAEAFAYSMQQRRRAVVIGERTAGGANPNRYFPLAPGLAVSISIGQTVNPVSHGNWEGTGVIPDVEVAAAAALETALTRARTGR